MTVSVRVNETVVEVEPAEPDRYTYELSHEDANAVYAAIDGVQPKDSHELYGRFAASQDWVPGKPAVTKAEKTYDIVGLTEEHVRQLRSLMYGTNYVGNQITKALVAEGIPLNAHAESRFRSTGWNLESH